MPGQKSIAWEVIGPKGKTYCGISSILQQVTGLLISAWVLLSKVPDMQPSKKAERKEGWLW